MDDFVCKNIYQKRKINIINSSWTFGCKKEGNLISFHSFNILKSYMKIKRSNNIVFMLMLFNDQLSGKRFYLITNLVALLTSLL